MELVRSVSDWQSALFSVIVERGSLKYYFCEYSCSVLDRKVRGSSILVVAKLFLAIKLQPDLIIRAILQVASILRKKFLKLRWDQKILWQNAIENPLLFKVFM